MYIYVYTAAAAAKSLQSCPTLCDPIDGSPPGPAVPGAPFHIPVDHLYIFWEAEGLNRWFSQKIYKVYKKVLNISNHQGNENQYQNDILPHTCQSGYYQKHHK